MKKLLLNSLSIFLFLFVSFKGTTQVVTDPSSQQGYDTNKRLLSASNRVIALPQKSKLPGKKTARLAEENCFIQRDSTYTAVPRNDDGSLGPITLPFSFLFYDTAYTRIWINTNGNITFQSAFSGYVASGFPTTTPMIAAFWGDVDTRNVAGGQIWYKVNPTNIIITWDSVGFYNNQVSLLNKFQIIIGILGDSLLGPGNNLKLNYRDMRWASSDGFGATTASTVGANAGNNVKYIQVGRFNRNDDFYDGPGGQHDGINYLDYKCFAFDVSNFVNSPPTLTGVPPTTITLNVGDSLTVNTESIGPEVGQNVVSTVNLRGLCRSDTVITNGVISKVTFRMKADTCNVGTNLITFTATDDGVPVRATERDLTVIVNKLNQTLSFTQPPDKIFGDPSFTLIGSATSGLPVVYSVISGPGFVSGNTYFINGVGNVTVRASQPGNTVYNAAIPIERTFCIKPTKPAAITGVIETCVGANNSYSTTNITGATFTWTLSEGGTLTPTGNTATIVWDSLGTFTITVKYSSNCATTDSVRTLQVQVISNPLSSTFSNMLPSNGNDNLSLPVTFSWFPVDNATSYDLYTWLDTATRPTTPTVSNISGINYTIHSSTILQYEKVYKWQLVAKRACFTLESPVQTFKLRYLPDLIVNNITNPATAFSGQSISLNWEIKNQGLGATLNQQWPDLIYMSHDAIFDVNTDFFLGSMQNLSELGAGASYVRSGTFNLPQGLNDNFYFFVVTNPYGQLLESDGTNNRRVSSFTTFVQLTPPPDLQVTSIVPPNFIFSGETINLQYKVSNMGAGGTVSTGWYDYLYLTKDSVLNTSTATSLGSHFHSGALAPTADYTRIQSVNIPQGFFGKYYFFVKTDLFNHVYEHASENNNTGRSDSVNILLTPPVDLVVSEITPLDSASNRQTIIVSWKVDNVGGSSTNSQFWTDYIYLSKLATFNSDSSIFVGSNSRPNPLEPGDQYSAQRTITIPSNINGNYYIYIKTDGGNSIFEHTFESNNVTRSNTPFKIISPDLVVSEMTVPSSDSSGHLINIQWKVKNNGNGIAYNTGITDRISISKHPIFVLDSLTQIVTLTYNTGQILNGDTLGKSLQVMLPNGISGNYYVYIQTDYNNGMYEGPAENNNHSRSSSFIQVTLSPWPDLKLTNITLADSAFADDIVPITFSVKNFGTATLNGTWKDKIYISTTPQLNINAGSTFLREIVQTQTLPADSAYTSITSIKIPGNIPDSAKYYIHIFTDSENGIYEHTAEGNNITYKDSIFIKKYPPIDLAIDSIAAPDSARSGIPVSITWAVENRGQAATLRSQWHDALYLSLDTGWNKNTDILVGEVLHTGILGAGNSYLRTENFTIPNGISGSYYLLLVTDHNFLNKDINPNNNFKLVGAGGGSGDSIKIVIELTPPPDLVVTLFTKPDNGPAGQPVLVKYEVKNTGTGTTPSSWTDKVYLSTNLILDAGDVNIGSKTRSGSLAPNAEYSDSLDVQLPISYTGNYVMIIKTDANDNVYEHTGENNNTVNGLITILQPPLSDIIVSNITNPPTALAGEPISIQWKVKNIGSNPASGYMKEAVYLSLDTIKDINDVLLVSQDAYINILPQAEMNRSYTGDLTGVSLKDYYVLVHTDVLNNIYESNDINNIKSSLEKTSVNVALLPINVLTANNLTDKKELYYRIVVADSLQGESLLVTLKADSVNGANELYLKYGDVPTRAVYDFAHGQPYQGNQEIVIPDLIPGTYYVMIYGETTNGNVQAMNVLAKLLEFEIRNVNANTGGNTGQVTIQVNGSKLGNVNLVSLRQGSNEIDADSIMIVDPTKLYVRFNLQGAATGVYDVIAYNENSDSAILTNGFTIVGGSVVNLVTNVVTPPSTRPSNIISMSVQYTNAGNTDIINPVLKLSSLGGAPIAFNTTDLANNTTVLTLSLQEVNGPPGVLRPGASGTILVYAKATTALGFMLIESK